jgi:hypothetical protein
MPNTESMPTTQISISHEFFKKERNNYSNFSQAIPREFFQNSIDAGASNIRIEFYQPGECLLPTGDPIQGVLLKFIDDGSGMTIDVLRDVYFCLGKTTKTGPDTVGGFGKARIATCLSHHRYGINTLCNRVVGYASDVEYVEDAPYVAGCEVWVDLDNTDKYGQTIDMVQAFKDYLGYCQLDCNVTSNVPELDNFSNWLYKRRHVRDLSFGSLYVNKSGGKQSQLIVRVNGVSMFSRWHRGKAQVVLELDFAKSRDILVSNRDSLTAQYEPELDRFLQEVAVDTHAALRDRRSVSEVTIGKQNAASITRRNRAQQKISVPAAGREIAAKYDSDSLVAVTGNSLEVAPCLSNSAIAAKDIAVSSGGTWCYPTGPGMNLVSGGFYPVADEDENEKFSEVFPSFSIYLDSDQKEMKKAAWLFNPENGDGKYFGSTKKKLALLWAIAIDEAVQAWLEITNTDFVSWVPGFVFSEDLEGLCQTKNGIRNVYIRPVDTKGSIRFGINNHSDRARLLIVAAHEVTHFTRQYHDEDYVEMEDNIMHKLMGRFPKIMRRMKDAVKSV